MAVLRLLSQRVLSRLTSCAALVGLALGGLVATSSAAEPAESWKGLRDEDGIRVSRHVAPSGEMISRAEAELEADLFEVLAVLADVARRVEWMSRCSESRHLARLEDGSALSYTRTRGIWPAADRDSVVRSRVDIAPDGASAQVTLVASQTPLAPVLDGVVRIPAMHGEYRLRTLPAGGTAVDYRISVDVGGRVPGFVQRFVRDEMPYDTLRGLRTHVQRTRAEYAAQAEALRERRRGSGSETRSHAAPAPRQGRTTEAR